MTIVADVNSCDADIASIAKLFRYRASCSYSSLGNFFGIILVEQSACSHNLCGEHVALGNI